MSNKKSKETGQSSDAEQISVQTKGATAHLQRMNVQRMQNVLLVWLDSAIDDNNADCRNTITQLRQTVNDISTFTNVDVYIDFLTDVCNEKVSILISDSLCESIIPLIHEITQLHTIYIFGTNQATHQQWVKECPKIIGVYTEIAPICEALKQAVRQCEQNAISISFVATDGDISKKNLDQLDPTFMYTQILQEILLTIKFSDEHIKQYTDYCRDVYAENETELKKMDTLQREYHTRTPIWWYTFENFLYPTLNRALRLMDMSIIIKMGFFIVDLHRHIEQLYLEQFTGHNSNQILIVYRGQSMLETDFDKMKNTQGGLMSFINFLSNSKDREISLLFAESNAEGCNLIGILFITTVDSTKSTKPFASVIDVGHFGDTEDEILFSMHTVFRIGEITPIGKTQPIFQVQLILTSENDKDLRVLTDYIRQEIYPNSTGWFRLASLLLKVGEFAKAQKVYEILLEQTTIVDDKGRIYHLLASTKLAQGEYNEAITFYNKALQIYKTLSSTTLYLADCYNNLSNVYYRIEEYPKALSYYEKVLEIQQQSLPSNHPDLSASYNNIGGVNYEMGDYPKALSYYEKAFEISKQ